MIKLLIKKEIKGLFASFSSRGQKERKNGTMRKAGFILLFLLLFISIMSIFFMTGITMSLALVPSGLGWFYFASMGIMALTLGIIGDVFNTYTLLYKAKDNDLLLSLPLPEKSILISRMVVVFLMGMVYEAVVFLPAIIAYWIAAPFQSVGATVLTLLFQLLLFVSLALLITTLSSFLGWIVALLSNRMKHKNFAIIILSIIFFGVYYFICVKLNDFISSLIMNAEAFSFSLRSGFYAAYAFGAGAAGDGWNALFFAFLSILIFALAFWVISLSFSKITTSSGSVRKTAFKGIKAKKSSAYSALVKREGRRFLGIPAYTLNAGLGIVVMPIALIALILYHSSLQPLLGSVENMGYSHLIPMVFAAGIAAIVSMDCGSAPSVSLEGNTLWVLKSLPLTASEILRSKIDFFFLINVIPALLLSVIGGVVLAIEWPHILVISLYLVAFTYFISVFGVFIGTVKANLNWTNPVVPVKNSIPVMITLFLGWITSLIMPLGGYFLSSFITPLIWEVVVTLLFVLFDVILFRWTEKKGARLFIEL